MSDTLSASLRSIDRQYLLETPKAQERFTCVKRKTELIDAEREFNPYLDELIRNIHYDKLRVDFEKLRREKGGGIAKKIFPQKYDPAHNSDVEKLATIIENVDHLYTRQIMEQPALFIASLSPLCGTAVGMYLQENADKWADVDAVKAATITTLLGFTAAAAIHSFSRNRNGHEIRPWNSIEYVQANLHYYRSVGYLIKKNTFDEAQCSPTIIEWEYYNKPINGFKNAPGIHPDLFNPLFKETISTKTRVLVDQIASELTKRFASNNAESL